MTAENYYIIVTLSDWLNNFRPVFQSMSSRVKTNPTLNVQFFVCFEQVTDSCL